MKITKKTFKALAILKENPNINAKAFAVLYYGEEHQSLFTAVSNQGNGACAGKKAWLCAGSLLGKLAKKGYVRRQIDKYGSISYYLTYEGKRALHEHENK